MDRRSFLVAPIIWALYPVRPGLAAPRTYTLAPDSNVEFTYVLAGIPTKGKIPISQADLSLDFRQVGRSRVAVTLDAKSARTTLPLANSAMKGPSILDTARFPTIQYTSTAVRRTETGASVTGNLRVRDVTQPVSLAARFFRQPDREPGDLRELVIELTGALSRRAFGATGYADLVGDQIDLRILASISRAA